MEQYTINKPNLPLSIKEGMYFMRIHQQHIESYGRKGANNIVATLTKDQIKEIAETKLPDLNCYTVEEAMNIVAGTAKNMGVKVEEN